jgi:hypothetical protein
MDNNYHSPEAIATFYLQEGAKGMAHWQFMAPQRMKEIFENLLTRMDDGSRKTKIKAILADF